MHCTVFGYSCSVWVLLESVDGHLMSSFIMLQLSLGPAVYLTETGPHWLARQSGLLALEVCLSVCLNTPSSTVTVGEITPGFLT